MESIFFFSISHSLNIYLFLSKVNKNPKQVEKKKQETPQEDVSQTLETFQQAFSDAVKESEDETETETEKEPTALSKIATSMKRFKFW